LAIPTHVLAKFLSYCGHCKRGAIARLSGHHADGSRHTIKDCAMIPLDFASPNAPTFAPPRPQRITMAAIAVMAFAILPALTGCGNDSSSSQAGAADPNDTLIARVNGSEIRQSDLAMAEDDFANELRGAPPDVKREQLVAYLTDVILVSQEAEKKNMSNSAEFKRRHTLMRNKLLMGALLQQQSKAAVTDEEMHKVYDEASKQMTAEEEVRARHILVETEEEAKAIVEQIKGGADFAAVAAEKSKDRGSAANGGDLDFMGRSELVPEFADVAFKMFPGQMSNPVKTQFGWHIIKLEDKRMRQAPTFEQLKDQIEAFVIRKAQSDLVVQLRQGAKIERLDKPATPASPAPPEPPAKN
jgi:peptidyl-prolyl cis-trans isomerase C